MVTDTANWTTLSIEKFDDLRQLPNQSGVYAVCDKNHHIVYIGKSISLRGRWWYSKNKRSPITPDEIHLVLKELKRKEKRSVNTKINHEIFCLIVYEGLLPSEICKLIKKTNGKSFDRQEISKRWKSSIKILGTKRVSELSPREGRNFYKKNHNIKGGWKMKHKMLNYLLRDGNYIKYKTMDKVTAAHQELDLINKFKPEYNVHTC